MIPTIIYKRITILFTGNIPAPMEITLVYLKLVLHFVVIDLINKIIRRDLLPAVLVVIAPLICGFNSRWSQRFCDSHGLLLFSCTRMSNCK